MFHDRFRMGGMTAFFFNGTRFRCGTGLFRDREKFSIFETGCNPNNGSMMRNKHTIKAFVLFLFILTALPVWGQLFRYEERLFEQVDTLQEVEYAQAPWLNNPIELLEHYAIHEGETKTQDRPLYMDIFMPRDDTLSLRPAIVFFHSGAFIRGSRLNDDMVALCDSFARMGYVTATADYRLGIGATATWLFGMIVGISVTDVNLNRSLYRAIQDGRAAVRYLKYHASTYGIDPSRIFIAGSSAGGFIALHNVYMDKPEEIPLEIYLEPSLGGLDQIGIQGVDASPGAIVSYWAAIQNLGMIEENATPVLLIHGEADPIVPFKKGVPVKAVIPTFDGVNFTVSETYGSFCIDSVLTEKEIDHQTYFVKDKKHEFYGIDHGEWPPEGPNCYFDTIFWKTKTFLHTILRAEAGFEYETEGLTVHFHTTASDIHSVDWDFGDGNTSTQLHPEHTYATPGEYRVKQVVFTRNLACDTLSEAMVVTDPVHAVALLPVAIGVYPNPVRDYLTLSGITGCFDLSVVDLAGRERVRMKNIQENSVNLTDLDPGIYLIRIISGPATFIRKIRKTR
jgi:acetyl esterase/lipase